MDRSIVLADNRSNRYRVDLWRNDFAADTPHSPFVFNLIEWARVRSVERQSADIAVPADLSDAARIKRGAGNYAAMCARKANRRPLARRISRASAQRCRKPCLRWSTSIPPRRCAGESWIQDSRTFTASRMKRRPASAARTAGPAFDCRRGTRANGRGRGSLIKLACQEICG